jgi:hypothetical protein
MGALPGCEAPEVGEAPEEVGVETSAYSMTNVYYDGSPGSPFTACTMNGISMHCCPAGFAMLGVDLATNVFKCGRVNGGMNGGPRYTVNFNYGNKQCGSQSGFNRLAVMIGYNESFNTALCQAPTYEAYYKRINTSTFDSRGMHVCPPTAAMTGINLGTGAYECGSNNLF